MADNEKPSLEEILKRLPPEDAGELVRGVVKITTDTIEASLNRWTDSIAPKVAETVRERLGYSDAVWSELQDIASKSGESYEDVLLKSLVLYDAAFEATLKGQRLVIVGPDYRFIREVVGIDSTDRVPVESGSGSM